MILPDELIHEYAANNVMPYNPANVNPASLDLCLGNTIRVTHPIWDTMTEKEMWRHIQQGTIESLPLWDEPQTFDTFWLFPRRFVLCHSLEFVKIPTNLASELFSKSSTGRIGLEHLHAGWGDCGWGVKTEKGSQWTFELHNIAPWPIRLEAGKRLMQMVMLEMVRPPRLDYSVTGRYNGQSGPTPAKTSIRYACTVTNKDTGEVRYAGTMAANNPSDAKILAAMAADLDSFDLPKYTINVVEA